MRDSKKLRDKLDEAIEKMLTTPISGANAQALCQLLSCEKLTLEIEALEMGGAIINDMASGGGESSQSLFRRAGSEWNEYCKSKSCYDKSHSDVERGKMADCIRKMLVCFTQLANAVRDETDCEEIRNIVQDFKDGIL